MAGCSNGQQLSPKYIALMIGQSETAAYFGAKLVFIFCAMILEGVVAQKSSGSSSQVNSYNVLNMRSICRIDCPAGRTLRKLSVFVLYKL